MSDTYMRWTPELREQLFRLRRDGLSKIEIADRMGLPMEKIENAYSMIRKGKWGAAAQQEFNGTNIVMRKAVEAKERGMSYGQMQAEKLCEQMTHTMQLEECLPDATPEIPSEPDPDTAQPIDMVAAVEILTACAKIFGMDELIETRGSKSHDKAAITFAHGSEIYVLEIFGTYE